MKPIRVIVNGKSAGELELRESIGRLRTEGHPIELRVTWEKGDATRFGREAVAEGIERIVAAGGDGTLQEVVDAIVGSDAGARASLGILPLGTANDFARAAGIPEDTESALRLVLDTAAVEVDAIRVGGHHGINLATAGFGTEVTTNTPEELKKSLGSLAYVITGITRFASFQAVTARVTGPGFEWAGPFLFLAAGNGRQAGGGNRICPDAVIDDGLLDVTILPDEVGGGVVASLVEWIGGRPDSVLERCATARLPWIEIEAATGMHLNLDGEPLAGTHMRVEIVPRALRVHLPADCELLRPRH